MMETERLGRDLNKTIEELSERALAQLKETNDPVAAALPGGYKTALEARLGIVDALIKTMLAQEKSPPQDRPPVTLADITESLTEGHILPKTTNALIRLMVRRARKSQDN